MNRFRRERDIRQPGLSARRGQVGTYGHAEDGLVGLVNITLGHFDGCDERKLRKEREEMDDSASQTGHFKGDGKKRREKGREGRKNSERRALVSGKKRAETLGRSWVFRWPEFAVAAAAMGVPAQFPLAGLVGPVRSREVLPIVRGNEKKHSQEKKKKICKKKNWTRR